MVCRLTLKLYLIDKNNEQYNLIHNPCFASTDQLPSVKLTRLVDGWLVYGVKCHFQQYFSYNMEVSFIGGGYQSTPEKKKPAASHWQTLSHNVVSSTPRLNGVRTHSVSGDRH